MLWRGGGCENGSSYGHSLSHRQRHLQNHSLVQREKLSQRNYSLSWCIPLLVLLLAAVPAPWLRSLQEAAPGPSCFMAGLSSPVRHPHADDGDGVENNPQNSLLGGVAASACPCQLPAEDCFTLNLARHPCAGTRLWCRSSCHGISTWPEL